MKTTTAPLYILLMLCLSALLLLSAAEVSAADYKVLDRSASKVPEWIYTQPEGSLLVEVEGRTLGDAQSAAETEIARRIVSAVATHISSSTSAKAYEKISDSGNDYGESFEMVTETMAARLPFIKGISISKANASYWEKRLDKDTGRQYVLLSVLYPLSQRELRELTDTYEQQDKEADDKLLVLRAGLDNITSGDQIIEAQTQLRSLQDFFIDKPRRQECAGLEELYKEKGKSVKIEGDVDLGARQITCWASLDGSPFRLTASTELKSNCAGSLSCSYEEKGYMFIISYSDEDCLDTEENWIEVTLKSKIGRFRRKFFLR